MRYNGKVIYAGERKQATIGKINESCQDFNKITKSKLSDREKVIVNNLLNRTFASDQEQKKKVTEDIGIYRVTAANINQFSTAVALRKSAIDILLQLFRERDQNILNSHASQNGNNRAILARRPSYFFDNELMDDLMKSRPHPFIKHKYIDVRSLNIDNSHFLFLLCRKQEAEDDWNLIIVSVSTGELFYIDPQRNFLDENYNNAYMIQCATKLVPFLTFALQPRIIRWRECCHYPYQYQEPYHPNNHDGVVVIMMIMYHIVFECPIYFKQSHVVELFRQKLAYWILQRKLPL